MVKVSGRATAKTIPWPSLPVAKQYHEVIAGPLCASSASQFVQSSHCCGGWRDHESDKEHSLDFKKLKIWLWVQYDYEMTVTTIQNMYVPEAHKIRNDL